MANSWKGNYMRYKDFFLNVLRIYYSKPNIKIYLELMLSLSTVIVFSIFAIKPTVLTIIELNKEINSKEETVTRIEQKLINLQKANDILQSEAERLVIIDKSIPDSANLEDLILETEKLATKNSLQILNLSISDVIITRDDESKKKKIEELEKLPLDADELPFVTSLTGSYQNMTLLLSDIENSLRPVKIDSIAINSSKTEEDKILVLTISGRLPYLMKNNSL